MAALSQAPGATVTLEGGAVTTAAQLGNGVWAIGSETISSGSAFTLSNSQVLSAGPSDLNLDGTAIHATAPITTGFAILQGPETTVTAYPVPGMTGMGVVNGQTISYGGGSATLDTGEVVSVVDDKSQMVEFSSTTGLYPIDASSSRSIIFSSSPGQVYPVPGTSSEESTMSTESSTRSSRMGSYTATETDADPSPTSASSGSETSTATGAEASETTPNGSGRVHLAWSSCCLGVLLFAALVL